MTGQYAVTFAGLTTYLLTLTPRLLRHFTIIQVPHGFATCRLLEPVLWYEQSKAAIDASVRTRRPDESIKGTDMRQRPLPGASPWSYALRGILGILLALYMLLTPGITLFAFVLAYGLFSVADGVIASGAAAIGVRDRKMDWSMMLGGLFGIGVGVFVLSWPLLSVATMSLLISLWMIAIGASTVLSAIRHRKEIRGGWLLIVAGLFPLGFGLYLLLQPMAAAIVLPIMVGGYAAFWGVLFLGTAALLWWRKPSTEK